MFIKCFYLGDQTLGQKMLGGGAFIYHAFLASICSVSIETCPGSVVAQLHHQTGDSLTWTTS